jgi:hypothetical protein
MQFNFFDTVTWSVKEGVWTITSVRSDNPPTYWIQLGDDVSTNQWAREEELTLVQAHQ